MTYLEEIKEKIITGRSRVKKRNRTVTKAEMIEVKASKKGTFIEYAVYVKACSKCWAGRVKLCCDRFVALAMTASFIPTDSTD